MTEPTEPQDIDLDSDQEITITLTTNEVVDCIAALTAASELVEMSPEQGLHVLTTRHKIVEQARKVLHADHEHE